MVFRLKLFTFYLIIAASVFGCVLPVAADSYVIRDARIVTLGDAGNFESASIVINDGEVVGIGRDLSSVPSDAIEISGENLVVTPGLFHALSTLGTSEVGAEDSTVDVEHESAYGPSFELLSAYNPRSAVIKVNRIEGVTQAMLTPRGTESQIFSGRISVVHLGDDHEYVVREYAGVVVHLGETGAEKGGGSRATAMLKLRNALIDGEDYRDSKQDYEEGATRVFSLGKSDLEALQGVLAGNEPLVVHVNRASDISETLKLAKEFNIEVVIAGGAEAWLVAEELAKADVLVIVDPRRNLPNRFESLNSRLDNIVKLHDAGVRVAISKGDTHNARNMTQLAGNAVANGLPWEIALRAITTTPGEYFTDDKDCCAIIVGEPADLVVWDGDPLEVTTFAQYVFVNGKRINMQSRQTKLRDRYLDLKDPLPFQYRK